jgi:hypothetical protein
MYTAVMVSLDYNTTYCELTHRCLERFFSDYRVGSHEKFSRIFKFKTFPSNDEDFSFKVCVFGDLGILNGVSAPYLKKAAANGEFDLIIHVGDISYDLHTNNGLVGDIYMRAMEPIIAQIPYLVIAGSRFLDAFY